MNIALVYDRVNKFGGAERLLSTLHKIWPEAPLYTAVYEAKKAPWSKRFKVVPSFLQGWPIPKDQHEFYPFLMPFAFESFSFDAFDIVISVTSAEAKGVITKPGTLHICYQLTPTRYLWSDHTEYRQRYSAGPFVNAIKSCVLPFQSVFRFWDSVAAKRPDYYIAISETVAARIKKYYQQEAVVMYPPVDTDFFQPDPKRSNGQYFLTVARFVPMKRVDLVISVFNELGWSLKIIGSGKEEKNLRLLAKNNIEFLGGNLTDNELLSYYQGCQALVVAGAEDFGLVGLEALACGRPVIAYKSGGLTEIVLSDKIGKLFYPQTKSALRDAVVEVKKKSYSQQLCRKRAAEFGEEVFMREFKRMIEQYALKHLG